MNLWIVTGQDLGSIAYHQVDDQWEQFGRLENVEVNVDSPVEVGWDSGFFDPRPPGERPFTHGAFYSQTQTSIDISLAFIHEESRERDPNFYRARLSVSTPPWLTH